MGISKAYLCQIETGKRDGAIKTLRALAAALGVSVDDLEQQGAGWLVRRKEARATAG